ncbi:MAG: AAA family ATPase, partial [Bacteroidetes bacterium]|nr:AAA family ATPase [Bacteroidota bacterium]
MAQVNLNIDDLKGFMGHIINNNRFLQKEGKLPVSIEVLGESGIGKTSTVKEIAEEHNLDFVKLNLAQIEELGDLVGFPTRQFQMYKEQIVKVGKSDNVQYSSQTAASEDLAKMSENTVTKKIGQWV